MMIRQSPLVDLARPAPFATTPMQSRSREHRSPAPGGTLTAVDSTPADDGPSGEPARAGAPGADVPRRPGGEEGRIRLDMAVGVAVVGGWGLRALALRPRPPPDLSSTLLACRWWRWRWWFRHGAVGHSQATVGDG